MAAVRTSTREGVGQEEAKDAFLPRITKRLVDITGRWRRCDNKACRRAQECTDAYACAKKHHDDVMEWLRECLVPYLRARYPTVQWGAGAAVTASQIDAALAAEAHLSPAELEARAGAALTKAEAESATGDAERG